MKARFLKGDDKLLAIERLRMNQMVSSTEHNSKSDIYLLHLSHFRVFLPGYGDGIMSEKSSST